MALKTATGHDPDEALRLQEEAERKAREAMERAQEEARKSEEQARETAEGAKRASEEAQQKSAEAVKAAQEAQKSAQAEAENAGKVSIGPTNRPFTEDQSFLLKQREAVRNTDTEIVKYGNMDYLPPELEEHREFFEKKNKKGEIIPSSINDWGTNRIEVDYGSIKDNDQAVYFASTLASEDDKKKFFKEYAARTNQSYEGLLAYADDKLGDKIFSSPQSAAGQRKKAIGALNKIGLFDVNGETIDVGTADFDMIVQSLNNIADPSEAKKAAAWVESLTKIKSSPYYGMTFDKDAIEYRDSANMPKSVYDEEAKRLSGIFSVGESAFGANNERYTAEYERIQGQYGNDPYAFRIMEDALKKAYQKQTGYVAPDSAKIQDAIAQIRAEREALAQQGKEEDKGFWRSLWESLFPKEKAVEDEGPVEGEDYTFREGYVASAGPSATSMPPQNPVQPSQQESAAGEHEPDANVEAEPAIATASPAPAGEEKEAHGPKRKPLSFSEALKEYAAGNLSEGDDGYELIADAIANDDFRNYVLNRMTPSAKQIYEWGAYGGTDLSDAQMRKFAQSITSGRQLLGKTIGGALESLETGGIPQDITDSGYQLMADIMNDVSMQIRSGRITVPAGENKYDYVIANTPYIKEKADQLAGLQNEVNGIMTSKAVEAAQAKEKEREAAELRLMSGRPTDEDLVMFAGSAKPVDAETFRSDKARRDMRYLLDESGMSSYYRDGGAFWSGNSAAAQEGQRLLQTQSQGEYDLFKYDLRETALETIDDLTNIAYNRGMTLEQLMTRMDIGIDQVMDMAYNRIVSYGNEVLNDPEIKQAAQDMVAAQAKSVGALEALGMGYEHGKQSSAYHFMNAPYALMDIATYESRRQEQYDDYNARFKTLASAQRRKDLIDFANSGEMPAEEAKALLEDIATADNIFDIAIDIDPGWLASNWREAMWEYKKDADALEASAAEMPEFERALFLGMSNFTGNARQIVGSAAITAATGALGAPAWAARFAGAMPNAFQTFSQTLADNRDAGLTDGTAAALAFGETVIMSAIESFGAEKTVADTFFGSVLARNSMEQTLRQKGTGALSVVKAMLRHSALDYGLGEAGEEVAQYGVGEVVDKFLPAIRGVEEGIITTPSQFIGVTLDELKATDPVELVKEAAASGAMGFVMGTLVSAPAIGVETYKAVTNVKLQKQYPSIDIASQITHGEIPASDENIGRFIDAMREDCKDPKFRDAYDKTADAAAQLEAMTVSAMSGAGHEYRVSAVSESKKAADYEKKANAAKASVDTNKKQYFKARELAMEGNEGAAHTMEGFRAAWGKAQTTETENTQAAQKAKEKAAEYTAKWLGECRKTAKAITALTKQSATQKLIDMYHNVRANEEEPGIAEAEANVEAVGAEEFIDQNYSNASDAEKDHIREIYGVPVGTKKEAAPAATVSETENVQAETAAEAAVPAEAAAVTEAPVAAEPMAEAPQTVTETPVQPTAPTAPEVQGPMLTGAQRLEVNRKRQLDSAMKFAGQVHKRFGVKVEIAPAEDERLLLPEPGKNGEKRYASALYNRDTDTIIVSENATQGDVIRAKVVHELTHRTEGTEAYKEFSEAIQAAYFKGDENKKKSYKRWISNLYASNGVKLDAEGLEHEVVSRITEDLLGGNQELVDRLVADSPSVARRIMDAIKAVLDKLRGVKGESVDQMKALEDMFRKALDEAQTQKRSFESDNIQYSLREKDPPKNVVYAYKAFYARDGKLYPPMVANITDDADKQKVSKATSGTMKSLPTPVGVWLDADIGGIMTDESGNPVRAKDTKRLRVKNDKSGGGATLAFRPGWHLGEWPDAKQFNKADPETGERGKRMPDDLVFAKCEVSADVDYQLDALSYGLSDKGSFSRSQAGLPYVPDDGYYKYRTNVDPSTAPWLIAGSIKVVEILDDEDCARICAEFGVTPDQRYSGKPIDLSEYGLKRGPVEETTEGMERFKENDANRANKKLLESALSDPEYASAYVQREIDFDNPKQYEQLQKEFAMNGQDIEAYRKKYEAEGFASSGRAKVDAVSKETGEPLTGTVKGDTVVQYSLDSWTNEERQEVRSNLVSKGYDEETVDNWIDDVNSIAAIVAADRDRLDFEAADNQVMLKPNAEYVRTLDASTLCAKRLLYQGTFNAIQHKMPNKVMTSDDLIRLRNMMAESGYETPCGICYVESRRRNLGTFAQNWLKGYDAKGGYQPKLDDVTTTDGLERMRIEHPEVYESFTGEMKRKGSNNPKVVQLRTDYRGDIRKLSKNDIEKIIKIGGLRVQSFSDFETPHLLDMMQAVLDMTEKGLTSQAYTKVPNFAWVFGDTGIKINLSLIAEGDGFDENGNLAFSSYEGMDIDEAMRLRDRYSKNVGTILVGLSDKHIRAAMADPRIDFIIPFHKSGWGKRQLSQLSGMSGYMDYTREQNERRVIGQTKTGKPKTKNVEENFHPVDYWNYDLTGDQNAETYLRMCEEDGRIPKFSRFLTKDADGHWVAPSGYWKLLIDFKMYDNDGVGAPQTPVMPNFNMVEAERILAEYKGGANELPVASDIVERFVAEKSGAGNVQYAIDDNADRKVHPADMPENNYMRGRTVDRNKVIEDGMNNVKSKNSKFNTGNKVFVENKQSGRPIQVTKDSIRHGLSGGVLRQSRNARMGAVIGDVLEDAVHICELKPRPGMVRAYAMLGATQDSNYVYPVKLIVNETAEDMGDLTGIESFNGIGKQYLYSANTEEGTKKEPAAISPEVQGENPITLTDSDIRIADLWESVKDHFMEGLEVLEDDESVQRSIDEPTLPDDDTLRAEIEAWKRNSLNFSVGSTPPDAQTGERQFATKTLQENQYIPDYIKQAFLNDPARKDYSRESNMRQITAAWNRVQAEGYEAARDRLVNQETKFDTDDNADALVLMRQALHDGDLDTLMAVATKYNSEGTEQAKALQIRRLMRTMTPTGFAQTVIQDVSRRMQERTERRPGERRRMERESRETEQRLNLHDKNADSAAETLAKGGSVRIDNKWGAPLNDVKRELIKEFKLEKTGRAGQFYNWATTKQRMLEDILTTDDVWAKDSNGLNLVDRLVRMKHGIPTLTKADVAYITDQMAIFDRLADKNGREADLALSRAYEAQGNINGATGRMKRRTWRYVSMLTSVPSAIRNVIGNTAQSVPSAIADGIAVELDRIISAMAGTNRTRSHLTARERIEGWEAFREETFNTFRDYFTDKTITQHGEGRYNQSQLGRVYQTQGLETLRHLEGLLMSVGDRNFWKKKFFNSMAEQRNLADINGTEFDVEAAMETAEAEANYATFNEDSVVRSLMTGLAENIPFLDYLMPFVGVPTNIIKRQIEFSPIGIAATAIRHGYGALRGENFDQRAFVDGMARGLTGTAMLGLGALLFKSGFLKLGTKEEEDDKSYGVRTAQGDQYGVYFTNGDKNYSISTFSPAASALVAGAFVVDAFGNNERWYQALTNGTFKNMNEIFDASYMSSLADALNTSNGKTVVENIVPAIGSAMVTQNIPVPLSHLASSMDEYVRDTKDKDAMMEIVKTTMNKLPLLREMLPEKVDVAGRSVENTKYGAAAFIDPFTTSESVGDPVLDEIIRLRDVLTAADAKEPRAHMPSDALSGRRNTLTQNKVTYTVTPEEKEAYRKRYGQLWREGGYTYDKNGRTVVVPGVEELVFSRYYQLLDDESKAKEIKDRINAAKVGATYEIMNHM